MDNLFAIHSVFIAKENILFLEEWIDYHILIGFDKFYLYDNSKVVKSGGLHPTHKCFVPGKVNKYGINYDKIIPLSDQQITQKLKDIQEKYNNTVIFIEWSPKDKNGLVLHQQANAHNNCLKLLKKNKIRWCANIDMDEYIVLENSDIKTYINSLKKSISNIKMGQIRFESRFNNIEKLVTFINKAELVDQPLNHSNKNIYKVSKTSAMSVHRWTGHGTEILPPVNTICFNHYKINNLNQFKIVNNINADIKNQLKLKHKKDL